MTIVTQFVHGFSVDFGKRDDSGTGSNSSSGSESSIGGNSSSGSESIPTDSESDVEIRKIKCLVMKRIEEEVQDQYKEAHLEHMRKQIQLIKEKKRKNETAQTQLKPVTPSVQRERPTDDEEEEGTFAKACRQKMNKYAEVVMKVQKQIREACDKAVEDQNVEECDKAAED